MSIKSTILLILIASLFGCKPPAPAPQVSDLDWGAIDIDQPIEQLEDEFKDVWENGSQWAINYTASNVVFLYRLKLKMMFEEYLESLPARERSEALLDQKEWLTAQREKEKQVYAEYNGGSGAASASADVALEGLKARIATIIARKGA